jgi:hypothetical protein
MIETWIVGVAESLSTVDQPKNERLCCYSFGKFEAGLVISVNIQPGFYFFYESGVSR